MSELMVPEREQAESLHLQIVSYGKIACQSLYGMCAAIKQMRDSKLYKALGYDTFEAYSEQSLGMKRSNAYSYISIAERMTEDFVHSSGHFGVKKLSMLATLTDDQRTEIVQSTDLEATTVRELKQQIDALKSKVQTAESATADKQAEMEEYRSDAKRRTDMLLQKLRTLTDRNKELENKPVEVAVADNQEELEQLRNELQAARAELAMKPPVQMPMTYAPVYQQDSKAVFRPYLEHAVDALKNLMGFLNGKQTDENFSFFLEKSSSALRIMMDEIKALGGEGNAN